MRNVEALAANSDGYAIPKNIHIAKIRHLERTQTLEVEVDLPLRAGRTLSWWSHLLTGLVQDAKNDPSAQALLELTIQRARANGLEVRESGGGYVVELPTQKSAQSTPWTMGSSSCVDDAHAPVEVSIEDGLAPRAPSCCWKRKMKSPHRIRRCQTSLDTGGEMPQRAPARDYRPFSACVSVAIHVHSSRERIRAVSPAAVDRRGGNGRGLSGRED